MSALCVVLDSCIVLLRRGDGCVSYPPPSPSSPVEERKRLSEEVSMLRALVKETRSSDDTVTERPTMKEHGCQTVAPSPPALAPTPAEPSLEKDVEELKTQLVCLVLCCVVLC